MTARIAVLIIAFLALAPIAADAQIGGTMLARQNRPKAQSLSLSMYTFSGHGFTLNGNGLVQ